MLICNLNEDITFPLCSCSFYIYYLIRFIIHNYIIKYLIFCMELGFCVKINGTQFYRDQY
ncbi:hypothetical protein AR546_03685 [Leptospira interrogans serovar Canicola]|nr:hypothetical protein AR546_03685 [Leptospira interrogans serovar Canicola]OMH62119.1 hypothetical protein BW243_20380 [Leptospira interrogans serovar Pomona]POR19920.1 hypothetical protein B0T34_02400 [Leptospira interrogans serovar Canicola]